MNKTTLLLLLIFTWIMTACGSSASDSANPASVTQSGPAAGELSAGMQVAIGTLKLDGTDSAVNAEQAAELLPLWQTLQVLYNSDTAADQEIDALIVQIQETMTDEQTRSIASLNLTRQDMMSIMQEQGMLIGAQNRNAQSGGTPNNNGGGFGPGGGGFVGPPPDGGISGGDPNFQGQGTRPQTSDSTSGNAPAAVDPNRIPTPLVQAVIEYLKTKN